MTLQTFDINNFTQKEYDYFYSILSPEKRAKVDRSLAKIKANKKDNKTNTILTDKTTEKDSKINLLSTNDTAYKDNMSANKTADEDNMSTDKTSDVERISITKTTVDVFANIAKTAVAGEMLARKMIADKLNISPEEIKFKVSPKGKPYVIDYNIFFNISHSHNMVVCGVSEYEIGVDIEKIRPIDLKIAKRICLEKELEYIFDGNQPNFYSKNELYLKRFFEIWTGKEAIFKCTGTGITDFKTVDTLSDPTLSVPIYKNNFIIRTAEKK